jgi:hypothetical protein
MSLQLLTRPKLRKAMIKILATPGIGMVLDFGTSHSEEGNTRSSGSLVDLHSLLGLAIIAVVLVKRLTTFDSLYPFQDILLQLT